MKIEAIQNFTLKTNKPKKKKKKEGKDEREKEEEEHNRKSHKDHLLGEYLAVLLRRYVVNLWDFGWLMNFRSSEYDWINR